MRVASEKDGGCHSREMEEDRALSPPSMNGMNKLFLSKNEHTTVPSAEARARSEEQAAILSPGPHRKWWLEQARHRNVNHMSYLTVHNNWGKPKYKTTLELLYVCLPLRLPVHRSPISHGLRLKISPNYCS